MYLRTVLFDYFVYLFYELLFDNEIYKILILKIGRQLWVSVNVQIKLHLKYLSQVTLFTVLCNTILVISRAICILLSFTIRNGIKHVIAISAGVHGKYLAV